MEQSMDAPSNDRRYLIAGWLAMASAVLIVPELGIKLLLEHISPSLTALSAPISMINLVIGIFLLNMLRLLLNERFAFFKADLIITLMICFNVASFLLEMVDISLQMAGKGSSTGGTLAIIAVILIYPFFILNIVLGAVLLKMEDDLFGLLKPFAYLTLASGICGVTLILVPLGLLTAIGALVVEGVIFLRAKERAEIL